MEQILTQPLVPIGEILQARGLITQAELDYALGQQTRYGGRLGAALVGEGFLSTLALHQAIAQHYQLPFVNLLQEPITDTLASADKVNDYIALSALPWRKEGRTIIIATSEPSLVLFAWAQSQFGSDIRYVITSPYDIRWEIERLFSSVLDEQSRLKLYQITPERSARVTVPKQQKYWFGGIGLVLLALLCFKPSGTLLWIISAANLFYIITIALKLWLFVIGHYRNQRADFLDSDFVNADDKDLPVYTILIPLYREEKVLPELIPAIRAIDYPKAKLDIKLIIEADDLITLQAAKALKPENIFEIIKVPYSLPRTKPKACNYALRFARGEYVTIYDAEDKPDPLQLKKAVHAFRNSSPKTVCLQSRLNYHNMHDNMLTELFALEYAAWFDYMLPGLEKLSMPIPLGGTSNHIALRKLRELGEWDPFNVTEDADLGMRLAAAGYKTAILHSITLEEAPNTFTSWIKQRSRWIKGYMQTWLVHMRQPVRLWRTLGAQGFFGFQFFIGGPCFVFLLSPILWCLFIYWLFADINTVRGWLYSYSFFTFFSGLAVHIAFSLFLIRERGWDKGEKTMVKSALVFPFYWALHSIASFRALWQLIVNPHFWDKTTHGMAPPTPQKLTQTMREFLRFGSTKSEM